LDEGRRYGAWVGRDGAEGGGVVEGSRIKNNKRIRE